MQVGSGDLQGKIVKRRFYDAVFSFDQPYLVFTYCTFFRAFRDMISETR